METKLYNQEGREIGNIELPDSVFAVPMNHDLVSQVVRVHRANARASIAHTKGRGDVRGGGKKPWRQKGTGRARHASIRSPIWKGGGVTFGPTNERNYKKDVNKKMKRKALFMVLSSKIADNQSIIIDDMNLEKPKTKDAALMIKNLLGVVSKDQSRNNTFLLIPAKKNRILEKSVNNIQKVSIIPATSLNVEELLLSKYVAIEKDAISVIEKTYKI